MPPTPPADRLVSAYRRRLAAVQAEIRRQIEELYAAVDPDAIEAALRAFARDAAPVIETGQQSTSAIAAAFIRTYTLNRTGRLLDLEDPEEIAGTRADGSPVVDGMAAFGPMILGRIGAGAALDEAMDFGRYLVTRYADGELTSAADRTIDSQSRGRFRSWEGIVSPGACDPCQGNDGVHDIAVEIYRHPGCNCTYVPLLDVG